MPVYQYKAITSDGKARDGSREAASRDEIATALKEEGLFVTDIRPITGEDAAKRDFLPKWVSGRRLKETSVATRQLATLLKTGVPLTRALDIVAEQAESEKLGHVFNDLRERISKGETLADAMATHRSYFDDLYTNMIRAAEASGEMDRVLQMLAEFMGERNYLRNKIISALTYPIFLATMGVVVVVILLVFVVEKIKELIQQSDKPLPWSTGVLLDTSAFVKEWWWALILCILSLALVFIWFKRTKRGKYFLDCFMIRVPVVGKVIRKQAIMRFSMTLQALLGSGMLVTDSLLILKRVMQNSLMREAMDLIYEKIVEGADISTPLQKTGMFPPMVGHMIAVGEESGQMEEVLQTITEAYKDDVDTSMERLTALIEPAMIVVLAVIIGLIVMAVMKPIMEMSDVL